MSAKLVWGVLPNPLSGNKWPRVQGVANFLFPNSGPQLSGTFLTGFLSINILKIWLNLKEKKKKKRVWFKCCFCENFWSVLKNIAWEKPSWSIKSHQIMIEWELLIQSMGALMLDVVLPLTDKFHYLFDIEIMLIILFYTIFQHYISVFGTLDLICPWTESFLRMSWLSC